MDSDPTRIDIDFDPTVQRMSGWAIHGNTPFDVPYISHIVGNMYQGGCAFDLVLPKHIEHVVSLYKWERYKVEHKLKSFNEYTMYDSSDGIPSQMQLHDIVQTALNCLEKGPTLIHCQAGLNRSSLVGALCLIQMGYKPASAVKLLRERRSDAVLCNKAFEEYVLNYVL